MKIILFAGLLIIVGVLGWAARALFLDGQDKQASSKRMVRALTWRVALTVALFAFVLVANRLGWIHPTGIALSASAPTH